MEPEHRLVFTARFEAGLAKLGADTELVDRMLEPSLYRVLRREPLRGRLLGDTGQRVIRQQVVRDVLLVQVYYRINEEDREVVLNSITAIDLTLV